MPAPDYLQPAFALYADDRLTDGDRTVYCLLMSFGDFGTLENCYPSTRAVADRGHRSRPAVVRSLTRLVATGWVVRAPRRSSEGDQDSTLYTFPMQARLYPRRADPVSETSRPCIPGEPTVVPEASQRVVSEASHYRDTIHREPVTERKPPTEVVADAPPPELELALVDQPPLQAWQKANQVRALWNATMAPTNPEVKPDKRFTRLLANAFDRFGDKLRPLLEWAAQDWKWSGQSGARTIQAFFAKDSIDLLLSDKRNTDAGTRRHPSERTGRANQPVAASQPWHAQPAPPPEPDDFRELTDEEIEIERQQRRTKVA